MTHPSMQQSIRQQALALTLAVVVTFGMLSGLTGLAQGDQAAQLAQQMQGAPTVVQVTPAAQAV